MIKRAFLLSLLAIGLCLGLSHGASGEDYLHEPTGISFPETLANLKRGRVANFESQAPGLGTGINYNGPGVRATIYAYTEGLKIIPSDLNSPVIRKHFREIIGDVMQAEKRGWIQNLEKISEGEVTWDEVTLKPISLQASFRFVQKGNERVSHVYLMAYKNHFIKVRLTHGKTDQAAAENLQKKILGELGNILKKASTPKQSTRPQPKFEKSYVFNKKSGTSDHAMLKQVGVTDEAIIVDLHYIHTPFTWWEFIRKRRNNKVEHISIFGPGHKHAFYIEDAHTGVTYPLVKIEKGPVYPSYQQVFFNEAVEFRLVMKKPARSLERIHIIEMKEGDSKYEFDRIEPDDDYPYEVRRSPWNFYNIKLTPSDPDFTDPAVRSDIQSRLKSMFKKPFAHGDMKIKVDDDINILNSYSVVEICSYAIAPKSRHRPCGVFAYNRENLLQLTKDNANLTKALFEENVARRSRHRPKDIASLVLKIHIPSYWKFAEGDGDILRWEKPFHYDNPLDADDEVKPTEYVADRKKLNRYKNVISSPYWANGQNTRDLICFCLVRDPAEWNFDLRKYTLSFDTTSSSMTIKKEIIETEIFEKKPAPPTRSRYDNDRSYDLVSYYSGLREKLADVYGFVRFLYSLML